MAFCPGGEVQALVSGWSPYAGWAGAEQAGAVPTAGLLSPVTSRPGFLNSMKRIVSLLYGQEKKAWGGWINRSGFCEEEVEFVTTLSLTRASSEPLCRDGCQLRGTEGRLRKWAGPIALQGTTALKFRPVSLEVVGAQL